MARRLWQGSALPRRILLASLIPPRLCGQSDHKLPLSLSDHPLTELFGQASGMEFRYVSSAVAESLLQFGIRFETQNISKKHQTFEPKRLKIHRKSTKMGAQSSPKSIPERPGDALGRPWGAVARSGGPRVPFWLHLGSLLAHFWFHFGHLCL